MSVATEAAAIGPEESSELPRRVVIASMAGVVAVMLLAALDGTIVGTAMPRVIAELNGFEHYASVTTVYMLAATVVVPIVGKLSDLYGRKPFLLAGVAIFVIGSALCGFAQSMLGLVVFRGIQGVGGGIAQGMAFTTIADLVPPARRGKITGVMGAVFGLASVIGPAVGGYLTDGPGWRWCFFVNLPVGVVAFLVLLFAFPHTVADRRQNRRVDWLGAVTLILGVVPVLLALTWGGRDYPWRSFETISLLGGGLLMMAIFIVLQLRTPDAIMPPALFRNRVVWTASAASTLMSIGMFGSILFIPLFIQGVIGRSPSQSGAVMTPMMFALIFASIMAGQLMTRVGRYKMLGVVGMSVTTLGMFLLSRMDTSTSYALVLVNMMVVGVGLGMTLPVFNLAVQNAVDISQVGVATSSVQFLRSIGASLGTAVFGAVLSNRFGSAFHEALPRDVASRIPAPMLSAFANPQALMDPNIASRIGVDPAMLEQLRPVMAAVRTSLSVSLHDVFLMGTIIAAAGIVFAQLVVDVPLRQSNAPRVLSSEGV
jgi:EmrB/QacA subfamily drug resistance transporter